MTVSPRFPEKNAGVPITAMAHCRTEVPVRNRGVIVAEPRQNNDTPKRVIPPWFILLVLLLLGFALFGDRGVLKVFKAYQQRSELEKKITELEQTNIEQRKEIDSLHHDLKAIENIARRELGMVRPDEQVYQFPSEDKKPIPQFPSESDPKPIDGPSGNSRVDSGSAER